MYQNRNDQKQQRLVQSLSSVVTTSPNHNNNNNNNISNNVPYNDDDCNNTSTNNNHNNTHSSSSSKTTTTTTTIPKATLIVHILSVYDLPYHEPPSYVQLNVLLPSNSSSNNNGNTDTTTTTGQQQQQQQETIIRVRTGPPTQRHRDRNSFKFGTTTSTGSSSPQQQQQQQQAHPNYYTPSPFNSTTSLQQLVSLSSPSLPKSNPTIVSQSLTTTTTNHSSSNSRTLTIEHDNLAELYHSQMIFDVVYYDYDTTTNNSNNNNNTNNNNNSKKKKVISSQSIYCPQEQKCKINEKTWNIIQLSSSNGNNNNNNNTTTTSSSSSSSILHVEPTIRIQMILIGTVRTEIQYILYICNTYISCIDIIEQYIIHHSVLLYIYTILTIPFRTIFRMFGIISPSSSSSSTNTSTSFFTTTTTTTSAASTSNTMINPNNLKNLLWCIVLLIIGTPIVLVLIIIGIPVFMGSMIVSLPILVPVILITVTLIWNTIVLCFVFYCSTSILSSSSSCLDSNTERLCHSDGNDGGVRGMIYTTIIIPILQTIQSSMIGQYMIYNIGSRMTPIIQVLLYYNIVSPNMNRYMKLLYCIIIDMIGNCSYIIPGIGETIDIIWAPIQTILIMTLFTTTTTKTTMYPSNTSFHYNSSTKNNTVLDILSYISMIEEIVPFTDIVPTATIGWIYFCVLQPILLPSSSSSSSNPNNSGSSNTTNEYSDNNNSNNDNNTETLMMLRKKQ